MFFHFKLIETIHQFVELIDPSYGNKIAKIKEQLFRLDIADERELGM